MVYHIKVIQKCFNNNIIDLFKRVKFSYCRLKDPFTLLPEWSGLSQILQLTQDLGYCPIAEGGKLCGNAALWTEDGLIVSRSGRDSSKFITDNFTQVVAFDFNRWEARFRSVTSDAEPTSDTPLHWAALRSLPERYGWKKRPRVSLHGHALETEEMARRLKIPISNTVTEFSTPADYHALASLISENPYPQNKIFIRKGHGFFILGKDFKEVIQILKDIPIRLGRAPKK